MGCSASASMAVTASTVATLAYFTDSQKRIVTQTWKIMAKDMTGNGTKVFERIFEMNPEIKDLFPFRSYEGEALLSNAAYRGHSSRFMQAVGAVVDNVDDPDTALKSLLLGLGKDHVRISDFKEEYFQAFIEGMRSVWQAQLDARYTVEVKLAWDRVFFFIHDHLKEGYRVARLEAVADETRKDSYPPA